MKYLDADSIDFGLQRDSRDELEALEAKIYNLLDTSSFQAYDIEDWSLAVELTSHLCFPEASGAVPVHFMIQVHPEPTTIWHASRIH